MRTFRIYVARALNNPEDPGIPPVFKQWTDASLRETSEKKRAQELWSFLLRIAIQERLREVGRLSQRYEALTGEYGALADLARKRMGDAADHLERLDKVIEGTDEILDNAKNNIRFDRARAIKFLKEKGAEPGPDESERSLLEQVKKIKRAAQEERSLWSKKHDDAENDARRFDEASDECRQQAKELIRRRDEICAQGCAPEEESQKLRALTEEYEIKVRQKAVELEMEKGKPADLSVVESFKKDQKQSNENTFLSQAFVNAASPVSALASPVSPLGGSGPQRPQA